MYYSSLLSFRISSHTWIAIAKYSVLHFGFTLHFLKYVFHSMMVSVDCFDKSFSNLLYFGLRFLIVIVLLDIYVFLPSNWFLILFLKRIIILCQKLSALQVSLYVLLNFSVAANIKFPIMFNILYLWKFLFVLFLSEMSFKQLISSWLLLLCLVELFCVIYELSIFSDIIFLYKFSISDL